VPKGDQMAGVELGRMIGGLIRPRTRQARALRNLAAAIQEFSDALQTGSTPLQVRVHLFCDPRGRPPRPALDITCQALTEEQLEQATASGQWDERQQVHAWSPGQVRWDVANRTPGRYRSRSARISCDGVGVFLRLDADAAFFTKADDEAEQGTTSPRPDRSDQG
jgi:hypothetical protein